MEYVGTIFTFLMNLATSVFQMFMGSWVTSIFIFGSVILLVVNLIAINRDSK